MGKMQREKGAVWERLVAVLLRTFWPEARRGHQSRSGRDGPDVEGIPELWVECKRGRRTNPIAALKQALEARGERRAIPVAICRNDAPIRAGKGAIRDPAVATATLRLDDFLDLLADPAVRARLASLAARGDRAVSVDTLE